MASQLQPFLGTVKRQILRFQSPTTGLFPSKSTETQEAVILDSIFCAASIWATYQAYHRLIDDDHGAAHGLGQSCVKCMRGILMVWMRQSKDKIENFKANQCPKHALPSKVDLHTGLPLGDGQEYGHLQLDVVSLYLLFLVQMINSGLQIIYTMDEVNFIQNLVYYVERAYRTPDFGMWGRGSKYNDGTPEIHASSIGMAKSALEAVNGCNLFGDKGASWSVIYVDIDAHSRNRSTFETLLPRESSSKNTDAGESFLLLIYFLISNPSSLSYLFSSTSSDHKLAMFCHSRPNPVQCHQREDHHKTKNALRLQTLPPRRLRLSSREHFSILQDR